MAKYVLLVLTNPVAGQEDRFNDWYSNVHVPECVFRANVPTDSGRT